MPICRTKRQEARLDPSTRRWGLVLIDLQRDLCYDERRVCIRWDRDTRWRSAHIGNSTMVVPDWSYDRSAITV